LYNETIFGVPFVGPEAVGEEVAVRVVEEGFVCLGQELLADVGVLQIYVDEMYSPTDHWV
jgi:hypothetical protein